MKILACQIAVPDDIDGARARDAHVARLVSAIGARLDARAADLVVLPELATVPYSRAAFARLGDLAEDADGPSFEQFSALARRHRTCVSFGMPRRAGREHRISQVLVDAAGRCAGWYDKLHMAQFGASMEKEFFARGERLLVSDVAGVRLGHLICYDFRFPELTRALCLRHGADLLVHPVAFCTDASFRSWHHFVVARALENQVWYLSLNRAGEEFGRSIFCPPWIDDDTAPAVLGTEQAFAYLELDPAFTRCTRQTYRFREDRREDYAALELAGPCG